MREPFSPLEVACVVPAMNEALVIESVVTSLVSNGFSVLVVDDGSNDGTGEIASKAGAQVIRHMVNCGQGAALETGFEAIRRGLLHPKLVVTFDADGQHSVEDLLSMIEAFNRNKNLQVALGTRFKDNRSELPLLKGLLLRTASKLTRFTLGLKVTDRHNGIRMFKSEALSHLRLTIPGYGHADEILRQIKQFSLVFEEIPVQIKYSEYSKAKGQPLINAIRIAFDSLIGEK